MKGGSFLMNYDIYFLLIFLFVIALFDYKKHIIPDELIAIGMIFKILYAIFTNAWTDLPHCLLNSLIITVPLLLLTVWMEKKTGKFQMGGGDVKLLGLMAFFLAPFDVLISLLIASFLQLTAIKYTKMQILPLAPALFISTLIVVFML